MTPWYRLREELMYSATLYRWHLAGAFVKGEGARGYMLSVQE